MSKPQPIEEIVAWSQKRSGWQQDALRRLAVGGTLTVADKADLLLLLKAKAGFELTPAPPAPIPLTVKDFTGAAKGQPVALKGIQGVKGVNRLVDGASITFSPTGLTVIYGRNGSGKSGYVRVLRSACRTRLDNPAKLKVLDNVYGAATGPQSAEILIDAGAGDTPVPWGPAQPKPDELLQVAVFDSAAAALYVDQGHQIRFLPFGLDLLHKLNEVCLEFRETLDAEKAQVDVALGLAVVNFPEERPSEAQKFYGSLSGGTADAKISGVTLFGSKEQARLDQLNELLGSGATSSTDLLGLAGWTATLATHCEAVSSGLGISRLKELAKLRKDYDAARKAASLDAKALFAGEPLDGVGESEWRLLWEAARNYSLTEAYPDAPFPVLKVGTEPASCVLCQQSLSEEAAQRLERFRLFVDGELNGKANAGKLGLETALAELPSLDVFETDDWTARLDQVAARSEAIAERLSLFRTLAIERLADAEAIIQGDADTPTGPALDCPSHELTVASQAWSKAAEALAATEDAEARALLVAEQAELQDTKHLAANVSQLKSRRDLLQKRQWIDAALGEVQTKAITEQANKFVDTHLTKKVVEQFNAERGILEIDGLNVGLQRESGKTKATFGTKSGTTITKAASDFLSEGEQRALALSAFLTEVVMTDGAGPIVVDDPVSSLDRDRCRAVADRLVQEGKLRQVVVFTHDLVFFNDLAAASHAAGENIHSVALFADKAAAGKVDPHGISWPGLPVAKRLPILKKEATDIAAIHSSSPTDYEYRAKNLYGRMRDTYERMVEECIFAGVISRGADRVETLKLRYVHLSDTTANAFHSGMTTANTYSHDNPAAATVKVPDPVALASHLSELEQLVVTINAENKASEGRRPMMRPTK